MMSGVVTQTLALSFMTWKTDWDQEVGNEAQIKLYKLI